MSPDSRALRIACIHLYDDFSGSAKVFAHAIAELKAAGACVRVTVGSAGESGFIRSSRPAGTVFYRFSENRAIRSLLFAVAQVLLFLDTVRSCLLWKADVVYANTVLAPGAVFAGWLCRRRVIVHLHEVGLGSRALFRSLLWVARTWSDRVVCVSEYMRNALDFAEGRAVVVYNSLSPDEWATARASIARAAQEPGAPFVVLMACSLKWYKGLDSFLALATRFVADTGQQTRPIRFRLLLNCRSTEWLQFEAEHDVAANVTVVLRPASVYEHYREAALVLNLSHREGWIETFGMTLLEAMACGIPVVSPVVGGCTELFEDGHGGWRLDSRNLGGIATLVQELAGDSSRWLSASREARDNAAKFNPERFANNLRAAVLAT